MCIIMLIQCLSVVKSPAARLVLAGERLVVCVSTAMPTQGSMVMKSLATRPIVAIVRTVIRMPAVVGLEC